MTRKKFFLLTLAIAAVLAIYAYVYRDWLKPREMLISHRVGIYRPPPNQRRPDELHARVNPVLFGFDRRYTLNEVQVIPLAQLQTNKYARPVWHLVTSSNSVPVKTFRYGERIRGMTPAVKGARPDALEPNALYRLIVQSGSLTAEHDFSTTAREK